MSKKRAGSASQAGTPANLDSGSDEEEEVKQQTQAQQQGKGKQAAQGSRAGGSGNTGGGGGGGGADTDLHALDDAVGIAGVDLNVRRIIMFHGQPRWPREDLA